MQSAKQTAKYFSEDLVYKATRDGKRQVGLVVGGCDSDSDDDENDSSNGSGGGYKIPAGMTKVAWYPTGTTQLVDEDKVSTVMCVGMECSSICQVELLDRALLPGDVVQYTGRPRQQQQMGIVADGFVRLDLRILGTDQVIRQVLWSDIDNVSPVDEQVSSCRTFILWHGSNHMTGDHFVQELDRIRCRKFIQSDNGNG